MDLNIKIGFIRKNCRLDGGASRFMYLLASELLTKGYEITIFTNQWYNTDARIHFVKLPMIGPCSFIKELSFAYSSKFIDRGEIDVLISFDRVLVGDVYRASDGTHRGYLQCKLQNKGKLYRLSQYLNPLNWTILWLEKNIFSNPHITIIANSRMVKEEIIKYYNVPEERIRVIYNGVDTQWFTPESIDLVKKVSGEYSIHPSTKVFCFVGSSFKRKGLEVALRALSMFRERISGDFKFFIIGSGKDSYYKKLTQKLGIYYQTRFVGPQQDVRPFYLRADIVLLPTFYDPFSNVGLEAVACGTPVITTFQNGFSEIITDNVNSYIVREITPTAVYEKIKLYISQKKKDRIKEECRKLALQYDIRRVVGEYISIIEEKYNER